ncbi:AlbA family DNA-binding domain-containing protein [Chitinophaga pinensis]|uniref:Schlafen AlbA-2 domain-containing protein n=1 Tax=Chitinophaga pinensis (strain ATCC 43595 / DSM 2588 / LMG 13176 / NBRC 15968 / NCIMB 11800 / UQM 2034) TaxID=485918 RepID=A0A979GWU2_CHIPD|nr:ATP-binding protein [Chitinophaga pinensis]ACU60710.1 hypothetical protein Cpin_3243 [Chitinophaga pinensis DSM 2588]
MFSELLFGKQLNEVSYDDVLDYFNAPKVESNIIEFKSYYVKDDKAKEPEKEKRERENGVLKTICGFLNSDGGIIVWGSPEGVEAMTDGVKEKHFYGNLTPVPINIPKDQFMARVVNSIIPAPAGVLYHQMQCPEGGFIYILEASRSSFPPHQFQNIYWMRLDGHTRAAPHHYIEALMKQIKMPDLGAFIKTQEFTTPARNHAILSFVLTIHNFSRYLTAHNVSYSLGCTYGLFFYEKESVDVSAGMKGKVDTEVLAAKVLHYNMPYTRRFYIAIPPSRSSRDLKIILFIYADNSPLKQSRYDFSINTPSSSPTPFVQLVKSEENVFSFEHSDKLEKTEFQRANELLDSELKNAADAVESTPMFNKL